MSKYLVTGSYTAAGAKGLVAEGGTSRRAAASAAIESLGGSVESFYYAFGEADVYAVCDFPDHAAATAASLMINASGAVAATFTPLMSAEDLDAAATSAQAASYRPPGG